MFRGSATGPPGGSVSQTALCDEFHMLPRQWSGTGVAGCFGIVTGPLKGTSTCFAPRNEIPCIRRVIAHRGASADYAREHRRGISGVWPARRRLGRARRPANGGWSARGAPRRAPRRRPGNRRDGGGRPARKRALAGGGARRVPAARRQRRDQELAARRRLRPDRRERGASGRGHRRLFAANHRVVASTSHARPRASRRRRRSTRPCSRSTSAIPLERSGMQPPRVTPRCIPSIAR